MTATPISPPSPSGRASRTVASSVTRPAGVTRSSRAVSRSVTSASPPGRYAIPHGTDSPVATSFGSPGAAAADTAAVGSTSPSPAEHAVRTASSMIVQSFLMCSILPPES
ncbi:hypothetical protein GCM10020001_028530 [Nonomuraea salmonea]